VDISAIGDIRPVAINDAGVIAALKVEREPQFSQFSILYDSHRGEVIRTWPDGNYIGALSNNGNTAGSSRTAGAWFSDRGGNQIQIPLANALGVNNAGVVVGFAGGFFVQPAVYSTDDGTLTMIGLGGTQGIASAVNSSGQVTGDSALPDNSAFHAFRWSNGVIEDLGTLGGIDYFSSFGTAIDASGRVTGTSTTSVGQTHTFLFDQSGMHDIGMLPDCTYSAPSAMNDHAEIVGRTFCPSGHFAFLYSNGELYNVNDVATAPDGASYSTAWGINNAGSIVGFALTPAGNARPYLLVRTGGRTGQ
jgi:probable HAF family extracellular repeat protein